MKFAHFFFLSLVLISLTACQDDDDVSPALEVPSTYEFTRDGVSTVSFSGQTTRLAMGNELADALKDPDIFLGPLNNMFRNTEGTNPFSDADLNASTKSVRSKVAASRDLFSTNASLSAEIKGDFDRWIAAQVNEVFPAQNQVATFGNPGQLSDGGSVRYVNAGGLEYNQAIVKGLIGALTYDQIANNYLSSAVLDEATNRADNDAGTTAVDKPYTTMEHKWDEAYGYLFGLSASASAPLADLGTVDEFMNKYLSRVENDEDYAGIADEIEEAFRTGRAAIVAGDYEERDRQAAVIIEKLNTIIGVRAIYYLIQGKNKLETTPTDWGDAFHDLSEGYGFVYSLRFIDSDSVDFETKVKGYLETLDNASGTGFWDIAPAALEQMAADIAADLGLSVAEAAN